MISCETKEPATCYNITCSVQNKYNLPALQNHYIGRFDVPLNGPLPGNWYEIMLHFELFTKPQLFGVYLLHYHDNQNIHIIQNTSF